MPPQQRTLEAILADVAGGTLSVAQAAAEIRAGLGLLPYGRRRKGGPAIVAVVFTILGCTFGAVGAGFALHSYFEGRDAEQTEGEVVRMIGGKGRSTPIVRYTVNGQAFEIQGSVWSTPPAYQVGEKVTVLYPRHNPADGRIDAFVERWLLAVVFGGVGALLLSAALVIAVVLLMRRRRRATKASADVASEIP